MIMIKILIWIKTSEIKSEKGEGIISTPVPCFIKEPPI